MSDDLFYNIIKIRKENRIAVYGDAEIHGPMLRHPTIGGKINNSAIHKKENKTCWIVPYEKLDEVKKLIEKGKISPQQKQEIKNNTKSISKKINNKNNTKPKTNEKHSNLEFENNDTIQEILDISKINNRNNTDQPKGEIKKTFLQEKPREKPLNLDIENNDTIDQILDFSKINTEKKNSSKSSTNTVKYKPEIKNNEKEPASSNKNKDNIDSAFDISDFIEKVNLKKDTLSEYHRSVSAKKSRNTTKPDTISYKQSESSSDSSDDNRSKSSSHMQKNKNFESILMEQKRDMQRKKFEMEKAMFEKNRSINIQTFNNNKNTETYETYEKDTNYDRSKTRNSQTKSNDYSTSSSSDYSRSSTKRSDSNNSDTSSESTESSRSRSRSRSRTSDKKPKTQNTKSSKKKTIENTRDVDFYKNLSKRHTDFKTLYQPSSDSDNSSLTTSETEKSDSSDDFPEPETPRKKSQDRRISRLYEKMKIITKQLSKNK